MYLVLNVVAKQSQAHLGWHCVNLIMPNASWERAGRVRQGPSDASQVCPQVISALAIISHRPRGACFSVLSELRHKGCGGQSLSGVRTLRPRPMGSA